MSYFLRIDGEIKVILWRKKAWQPWAFPGKRPGRAANNSDISIKNTGVWREETFREICFAAEAMSVTFCFLLILSSPLVFKCCGISTDNVAHYNYLFNSSGSLLWFIQMSHTHTVVFIGGQRKVTANVNWSQQDKGGSKRLKFRLLSQ